MSYADVIALAAQALRADPAREVQIIEGVAALLGIDFYQAEAYVLNYVGR